MQSIETLHLEKHNNSVCFQRHCCGYMCRIIHRPPDKLSTVRSVDYPHNRNHSVLAGFNHVRHNTVGVYNLRITAVFCKLRYMLILPSLQLTFKHEIKVRLNPHCVRAINDGHVLVIVLLVYGNYMSAMGGKYDNIGLNVSALTDLSLLFIQW